MNADRNAPRRIKFKRRQQFPNGVVVGDLAAAVLAGAIVIAALEIVDLHYLGCGGGRSQSIVK